MKRSQKMIRQLTGTQRWEAGLAAAEMAVAAPILMLIMLGTVDFGRFLYFSITLANAARSGAQYAALNTTNGTNTTAITQAANLDAQDIGTVTVTSQRFCKCQQGASVNCDIDKCGASLDIDPQQYVEVTASKTFEPMFPYPGLPAQISLSRKATLRAR